MAIPTLASLFADRIGQHLMVFHGDSGLVVEFSRGSHTLTGANESVIETTSPAGDKHYYSIARIAEVRVSAY